MKHWLKDFSWCSQGHVAWMYGAVIMVYIIPGLGLVLFNSSKLPSNLMKTL